MLSKIVYRISDGLILSIIQTANLNAVIPVYDNTTASCTIVDVPNNVKLGSSNWFFSGGAIVKNLYGVLSISVSSSSIPADGISTSTFTVSKMSSSGIPLTSSSDNDLISISATRGRLSSMGMPLINGVASFTLTSVSETVSSVVAVSNSLLGSCSTNIQFTP